MSRQNSGHDSWEQRVEAPRRIWLVADDYGIAPGVNAAIRDLVSRRRLNATSVMVVAASFDAAEAGSLAALNAPAQSVAIGLHLTLTAPFRPMSEGFAPNVDGVFPSLGQMMRAAFLRRLHAGQLAAEIEAQLAAFAASFGHPPAFIDGHRHVHLLPQIRQALIAAAKTKAPQAWLRQCAGTLPVWRKSSSPKGLFIDLLSRGFARAAGRACIRTNPSFAGAYEYWPGADFAALFPHFLAGLPEGGVVMCHPGKVDAELERLDPLTTLREAEYAYLSGPEFPRALAAHGLTLA